MIKDVVTLGFGPGGNPLVVTLGFSVAVAAPTATNFPDPFAALASPRVDPLAATVSARVDPFAATITYKQA